MKGPSVMMGYYKRPDLTAETVIDGWLHTGDIGIFEDGKYLKITDRISVRVLEGTRVRAVQSANL